MEKEKYNYLVAVKIEGEKRNEVFAFPTKTKRTLFLKEIKKDKSIEWATAERK